MLKKKKCATKRGKWSQEYKVKVSVNPVKRKKKGSWGVEQKGKLESCPNCGKKHKVLGKYIYCTKLAKRRGSGWNRVGDGVYRVR